MARRRLRLGIPLSVLALVGVGIAALAGAFSSSGPAQPVVPKLPAISARAIETQRGTPATVSLSTTFGGQSGAAPTGRLSTLELDLGRGFHFDPRAAATCTDAQAGVGQCPSDSAIGGGEGEILVQGRYLPQTTYDVSAAMFLTAPTHPGDIAGVALDLTEAQSQLHAVMLGRVIPLRTSTYAIALRFPNASRELSQAYDLNLRRLTLRLQSSRTIGSQRFTLLTNPTPCQRHGWPLQLSTTSASHAWIYHASLSCRASARSASNSSAASASNRTGGSSTAPSGSGA